MITYDEVLSRLNALSDEGYRAFHGKLLKNNAVRLIGVRMPALRALAREWQGETDAFLRFPDEYYEVTFLKCALVGALEYGEFIMRVDRVVPLLNNWATCDCFASPCIQAHREEFLPFVQKYLHSGREFTVRYALVTLLRYYVTPEYLPLIFESVLVNQNDYYVMMAAAWLVAEVLVKHYDAGVAFLQQNLLPSRTHNKAIQKACESFRVSKEQKAFLKTMRRGSR